MENIITLPQTIYKLIFCGDIHGNLDYLKYSIKAHNISNTCIILCGDVGLGFNEQGEENIINKLIEPLCEKNNVYIIAVRGNHDNPEIWNNFKYNNRFKTVPDYSIINVCNNNILCIGGGTSIDRIWRINNKIGYWPDEKIVKNEKLVEELSEKYNINIVASHCAPHEAYPYCLNKTVEQFILDDPQLEVELHEERAYLSNVLKILKYKSSITHWIYGHYHASKLIQFNDVDFRLLNCGEFYTFYVDKS